MNPSNIAIHIEKAIIRVTPGLVPGNLLKASFIDLSASSQIRGEGVDRFELVLDGNAVMDHRTGLMWWVDESEPMAWEENASFCKNFALSGFSDWSQGSDEQWGTIIDRKLHKPCLPKPFKSHGEGVWTSTETAWSKAEKRTGASRSFWCVSMSYGDVFNDYANYRFRARPVRV